MMTGLYPKQQTSKGHSIIMYMLCHFDFLLQLFQVDVIQ